MLSRHSDIYDLIVPKDNILRQIKDLVDFGFIYEELRTKYCPENGRNATDPIVMFKYLLLKIIFVLSDIDVVDRSRYDMSFKYFLDMAPEDPVIEPSSLMKFRTQRLKDSKSREAGIDVKTIIGDAAYSEKDNIEFANENKIELVSKLSKTVTHGNTRASGEFEYNKDADIYVCKAGHMSTKKLVLERRNMKRKVQMLLYLTFSTLINVSTVV